MFLTRNLVLYSIHRVEIAQVKSCWEENSKLCTNTAQQVTVTRSERRYFPFSLERITVTLQHSYFTDTSICSLIDFFFFNAKFTMPRLTKSTTKYCFGFKMEIKNMCVYHWRHYIISRLSDSLNWLRKLLCVQLHVLSLLEKETW